MLVSFHSLVGSQYQIRSTMISPHANSIGRTKEPQTPWMGVLASTDVLPLCSPLLKHRKPQVTMLPFDHGITPRSRKSLVRRRNCCCRLIVYWFSVHFQNEIHHLDYLLTPVTRGCYKLISLNLLFFATILYLKSSTICHLHQNEHHAVLKYPPLQMVAEVSFIEVLEKAQEKFNGSINR